MTTIPGETRVSAATEPSVGKRQCAECGRWSPLTKRGMVRRHVVVRGGERTSCGGSGQAPSRFDPRNCPRCMEHYFDEPFLVEACASVGIERNRPTAQMLNAYLLDFHRSGHVAAGADGEAVR